MLEQGDGGQARRNGEKARGKLKATTPSLHQILFLWERLSSRDNIGSTIIHNSRFAAYP
jgi:hypothetical protein